MNIQKKCIDNLKEEIHQLSLFTSLNLIDNNLNKFILSEDISVVLKILKFKTILIYDKKSEPCNFDIELLCNKIPENDLILFHDILFYSIIIQPSLKTAHDFLCRSVNFLSNNLNAENINVIVRNLEIILVISELGMMTNNNLIKDFDLQNQLFQLITNLVCSEDIKIQRKVIDIIPKYIHCTNKNNLFLNIWDGIQKTSNQFSVLIALIDYFISPNYNEFEFNILHSNTFWCQLQKNITISNPVIKKQSIFLLKKAIETLFYNETYLNDFSSKLDFLNWGLKNSNEHKTAWKHFFILCEVSREKQIHLIEPTFKLYSTLKILHFSWRNCITKLFIFHSHSAVVRKTIINVLKSEWVCDMNTLLQGLNNNFLFENTTNDSIVHYLNTFIFNLKRNEFLTFLTEIFNACLSPIPFYYTCKSLESYQLVKTDFDLKIVINLLTYNEKIPHLYIRRGIFSSLFSFTQKIITNVTDFDKSLFVKIIYLLHKNDYLIRNNYCWKELISFLKSNKNQFENIINQIKKTPSLLSKEYLVFVVLLIDCNILELSWIKLYLNNINNKLDSLTFFFNLINILSEPDQIFKNEIITEEEIKNIFNDIFNVCNEFEIIKYNCETFEKIEYIFDILFSETFLNENYLLMYKLFIEKLKNNDKSICYIILNKQIIQIYELNINLRKKKYVEELQNVSIDLSDMKNKYDSEFKDIIIDNSLKHKILTCFYYTKLNIIKLLLQSNKYEITDENILSKINEYYDKGGLDIIVPIINTLNTILNSCDVNNMPENFTNNFQEILIRIKKDIFHIRTNELFKISVSKFVSTILHPKMFTNSILKNFAHDFCINMFDSSQIITGIRNEILHRIRLKNLNANILVEALTFGNILRKDQRIEFETCDLINQHMKQTDFSTENPCQLDGKVRSKAVSLLLTLLYNPPENFNVKKYSEEILTLLLEKYDEYAGKRYFGDSQIHFKKLRIVQSLHIIVPKLNKNKLQFLNEWLFDCLTNESQQPSITVLIQWLMMRIYYKSNKRDTAVFNLLSKTRNLKGTSVIHIFPILYHLIKDKSVNITTICDCIDFLLPFSMGQHFNIRFSAQVAIKYIFEVYETETEFSAKYSSIYRSITEVISQTVSEKNCENILTYYNLYPTIETIFYDVPRLTNVSHTEWMPIDYFHGIIKMKLRSSNELSNMKTNTKKMFHTISEIDDGNTTVQKKIDPFSGNNIEIKNNTGELIVVACLIDKAPNLGGLSRTCEVFGVKQYVLNNIQFAKSKEYQSLSMSSEKWVETIEVKLENLPNYLIEMKKNRYKIIGAEQTSNSITLNNYKFDKNTVLLLGNEKEGIPPNLIHLLDECIEIPQTGQIRSLNVHVAAALFIWEYARQHNIET